PGARGGNRQIPSERGYWLADWISQCAEHEHGGVRDNGDFRVIVQALEQRLHTGHRLQRLLKPGAYLWQRHAPLVGEVAPQPIVLQEWSCRLPDLPKGLFLQLHGPFLRDSSIPAVLLTVNG